MKRLSPDPIWRRAGLPARSRLAVKMAVQGTFHRNHLSPNLCKARCCPECRTLFYQRVKDIKVWFCSILKIKEHHLNSWRERTVCQENASSCLLSRLKEKAGETFISASAQEAVID